MTRRLCTLAAMLVLAANIVIRFETQEIELYVEPGTEVGVPAEFVTKEACGLLRAMHFAFPVTYRIQWHQKMAPGSVVPDESKVVTGTLKNCDERT